MDTSLPVAVHLLPVKDGKILLLLRKNTGFKDNLWSVPAGRLKAGESVSQAAVREGKEEVGISVNVKDLGNPLVMHHRDERGERLYFFFPCEKWDGIPENKEPDKCSKVEWFDLDNLPTEMVAHVGDAIKESHSGTTFLEYNFD